MFALGLSYIWFIDAIIVIIFIKYYCGIKWNLYPRIPFGVFASHVGTKNYADAIL